MFARSKPAAVYTITRRRIVKFKKVWAELLSGEKSKTAIAPAHQIVTKRYRPKAMAWLRRIPVSMLSIALRSLKKLRILTTPEMRSNPEAIEEKATQNPKAIFALVNHYSGGLPNTLICLYQKAVKSP